MKNLKATKQLPNFITGLNMLLGLSVIFMHIGPISPGSPLLACIFILTAAFLDAIDGRLARFLKAESHLGKQLDSFADFVSFGLAPMVILLAHPVIRSQGWPIYACFILYALAGGFRLARFNLSEDKGSFTGLPITAAGFLLILLNLFLHTSRALEYELTMLLVAAFVCLLSAFMVSTLKIPRPGFKKPQEAEGEEEISLQSIWEQSG